MADEELKIGYYVFIEDPLNKFYKVTGKETLDYETGEEDTAVFSAVSSGSESGYKNIELLEPDERPLHLFRVELAVKDTLFKYYVKLPTGTDRYGVDDDKDIGFIDGHKSPAYDPNPDFTFWIVHDYYPSINAKNVSPFSMTPKIYFTGTKYDIEEVKDSAITDRILKGIIPCRRISIAGIKTSSGVG